MNDLKTDWNADANYDLLIESRSSVAVTISVGGYNDAEHIIGTHVSNSDRSLASTTIPVSAIPKFLTAFTNTASVSRGACFVSIWLRVNGVKTVLLAQGYITTGDSLSYPHGKIENSTEGRGLIRSITGTNPAAGVEISETVPTGAIWHLISLRSTFVADATVANRVATLILTDGTNQLVRQTGSGTLTASQTAQLSWSTAGFKDIAFTEAEAGTIPASNRLPAGFVIATSTVTLQAGDNHSAPQLLVEEWIQI